MKRTLHLSSLALVFLAGSLAHAEAPANYDAYLSSPPVATAPRPTPSGAATGSIASTDPLRNVPTFFWAAGAKQRLSASFAGAGPDRRARAYLDQNAAHYHLTRAALNTAYVKHVHDTGRGGIIVTFGQRVSGTEVFHTEIKVLMDRNGDLVAIGGNLHDKAVPGNKGNSRTFTLSNADAIATAFADLYDIEISSRDLTDLKRKKLGYSYFDLKQVSSVRKARLAFNRPARAKKVFYPLPDRLVPAYYLELDVQKRGDKTSAVFGYVIAADNGELLLRKNLTQDIAFNYRVWAQPAAPNMPLEGPQENYTPHPTGMPDGTSPGFVSPILVSMEGFNTNPGGAADPWLAATATQSLGNNVDAYADLSAPDGFSGGDLRATTTAANTFDRTYDTALAPAASNNQIRAAVTQIFYTINWLHDYYYDSGFDEASGNAQTDNYGRGGAQGDPLLAEAQDYSGFENANMSTPADGQSPRMQMYLWGGPATTTLNVQPINLSPPNQAAGFGPAAFNTTAELILGVDGNMPTGGNPDINDACQNLINNVAGKIVLVNRGTCSFESKVQRAQNAGAVGVLITNNATPGLPPMGDDPMIPANAVTIGSLGISQADGDTLKAELMNGTLTVTMSRTTAVNRDGTIDNSIVAHEWGHYIHNRLVACGTQQCGGEGEGWGDFIAMMLAIQDGENVATGTYAASIYSTGNLGDEGYFGIRRFPYSRDTSKNGLTFKHVTDNEPLPSTPIQDNGVNNWEVHNAGEVWTTMLFQAYTGLILNGGHTFDEAKRRMADYIVAGMKLAPVNPTYTEQRDGILAAAVANDPNDFIILAQGFADRGAGTCAVSPPSNSTTGAGVVEDFTLSGRQEFVSLSADDSVLTCDGDGILDGEEAGKLYVEVMNSGAGALTNTQVTVSTMAGGVTFPNGATATIPSIAPFSTGMAQIDIALNNSFVNIADISFNVSMNNAAACTPTVQTTGSLRVNYDEVLQSSTTDTVESPNSPWVKWGAPGYTDLADDVWSRSLGAGGNYRWYGQDYPSHSDTALESPSVNVATTGNLVLTFDHAYDFEASFQMGQWTYWDGGLIEITSDGGQTWEDISVYAAPGYGGTIAAIAGADNPLGGRDGFVEQNQAWPNTNNVSLNLGTAFAGQTIKVRFRIGTDALEGVPNYQGWYIDNISFQGITNTPFPTVTPDPLGCNGPPIANAGPDQIVNEGDFVMLDGSMSSDPENDPLTHLWSQSAGPMVMLSNPASVTPSFTAPQVAADTTLTFDLQVDDGTSMDTDSVTVLVLDVPIGTGGMGGAGGMGTGGMGGVGGVATGGMGGVGGVATGGMGGVGGVATGGMGGTGGVATGGMGGVGGVATGGMGGSGGTGGMGGTGGAGGMATGGTGGMGTGGMATGGTGGVGTGGVDAGGSGGTGGGGTAVPEGGCACDVPGQPSAPSSAFFAPFFAALAWLARRRRSRG